MNPDSEIIEDLGSNVKLIRRHNGRVVGFELRSMSREAIDTWAATVMAENRKWPKDQIFLVMHDFEGQGMTPYSRRRAEEINAAAPDYLFGRAAIVLPSGLMGTAIKAFAQLSFFRTKGRVEGKFFSDSESALAWLEERL